MRLKRRLLELFAVRSDEAGRVAWLATHSLFIGVFCAYFFSAANALFLSRFEISVLPIAYIVSGLVGYLTTMLFSRLERSVSFRQLLMLNLGFLLVVAGILWYLAYSTNNDWVIFFMFVWVVPSFSLIFLGYWALAVRLFDLRQGKRLFGLVGAGEEVATVIGLFSVPLLMKVMDGPVNLILISTVGLFGCLIVVAAITVRYRDLLYSEEDQRPADEKQAEKRSGLLTLLRNQYFLLMAALVILLSLGAYIVDFAFLSQIRIRFDGPAQIAQFIGIFFGISKIFELIMKAFVSGRLLNHFGLKSGLMLLPVLLGLCAGLAIVIGIFGLGMALFFVLVALSKMIWAVVRTSTFLPSFRVLYQPIRGADRLAFQTHVDGTAKQLATLVVGCALLLFARSESFNALNLFYVLLPIFGVWVVVVVRLHGQYRARLMANLSEAMGQAASASPVETLIENLLEVPPDQLENAVAVLARVDATAVVPMLTAMMERGDEAGRIAAIKYVGRLKAMAGLDSVRKRAAEDEAFAVREAAASTIRTMQEVKELTEDPDRVRELAVSPLPAQRDLAVSAIGFAADPGAHVGLTELLWDKDRDVRRAALVAAGRVGHRSYWHRIISQLFAPKFSNAATFALITVGDPVLGEVERAFSRAEPHLKSRILRIYERVATAVARALLLNKLDFPDKTVRNRALISLSRSDFQAESEQVTKVENEIESVIRVLAWNMSAILDLGEDEALKELREALESEIEGGRDNIFLLLSLLYDASAIDLVRRNLDSGVPEAVVYALEIMDIVIHPELKPLLFPVLEDASYAHALKRLDPFIARIRFDRYERLSAIVAREHDKIGLWTRACAVKAIGELEEGVKPELVASLFHPQPIVREIAARCILEKDPEDYQARRRKLPAEIRERLDTILASDVVREQWESHSVLGRARVLSEVPAFANLSWEALVTLADSAEAKVLKPGQQLPSPKDGRDSAYVVLDGDLELAGDGAPVAGPSFTRLGLVAFGPGARPVEAPHSCTLIRLDPTQLFELATEYTELINILLRAGQQLDQVAEEAVVERHFEAGRRGPHELGLSG